ncbi:hypothetical protein [Acaryochloris sp. CCMEE 5410]|uniref:hypothetical protein n=1 Tax=Acaryochloris sp. CCMEE 5410 TaxID=310037 RepID=UPI0002484220|nr:hypothetical protein [Acaryochloris sp. CCMEE 5410]KAI9129534.1 hypothetical protein ON05_033020 [Acaryochloris sp. CCMEE 5410]
MLNDPMTQAWQPWTDAEMSERNKAVSGNWILAFFQDGYSHDTIDSGDSKDCVPDTHPEDN